MKPRTTLALTLVLTLSACLADGSQTGDSGAGGLELCEVVREETLSVEQAEAEGFDTTPLDCDDAALELSLVGPPALWTLAGLEMPIDRTVPIRLSIEATDEVRVTRLQPTEAGRQQMFECDDYAALVLDVRIEIPDLGLQLSGRGVSSERLRDWSDPTISSCLVAEAEIDELGTCSIRQDTRMTPPSDAFAMLCGAGIFATETCSAEAGLVRPLSDPRSGLGAAELLERALTAFPMPLSCSGAVSRAEIELSEVRVPEQACGPAPFDDEVGPSMPITVTASFPPQDIDGAVAASLVMETDSLDCAPKNCPRNDTKCEESQPSVTESPMCTLFRVRIASEERLQIEIEVDDSGRQIVAVLAIGSDHRCQGERELE